MLYTYAAIIRKDLGQGKYSQQLQQGWLRSKGNEDEATGFAYKHLSEKNAGGIIEDLIVMEIKGDEDGED